MHGRGSRASPGDEDKQEENIGGRSEEEARGAAGATGKTERCSRRGELERIPACPAGQAMGRSLRSAPKTASSRTTPSDNKATYPRAPWVAGSVWGAGSILEDWDPPPTPSLRGRGPWDSLEQRADERHAGRAPDDGCQAGGGAEEMDAVIEGSPTGRQKAKSRSRAERGGTTDGRGRSATVPQRHLGIMSSRDPHQEPTAKGWSGGWRRTTAERLNGCSRRGTVEAGRPLEKCVDGSQTNSGMAGAGTGPASGPGTSEWPSRAGSTDNRRGTGRLARTQVGLYEGRVRQVVQNQAVTMKKMVRL